jgi:hypothetical protein
MFERGAIPDSSMLTLIHKKKKAINCIWSKESSRHNKCATALEITLYAHGNTKHTGWSTLYVYLWTVHVTKPGENHNGKQHNLYSSPNTVTVIKWRIMRRRTCDARAGNENSTHNGIFLIGQSVEWIGFLLTQLNVREDFFAVIRCDGFKSFGLIRL